MMKREAEEWAGVPVTFACNTSMASTLVDITKQVGHDPNSAINVKIATEVIDKVHELLDEGKRVLLIGRSYGGLVVSSVADHFEIFDKHLADMDMI